MPSKPKKRKTVSKLKKELWTIFSRYIRMRDAGTSGLCRCFTCSSVRPWKYMDAGHWRKRNLTPTLFDERNVHAQCPQCNRFKDGKPETYRRELIKRYGEGIDDELYYKSLETKRFTRIELEEMIAHYKEEVKKFKYL